MRAIGGKVLITTQSAIKHLVSARLAADVMGVPTISLLVLMPMERI